MPQIQLTPAQRKVHRAEAHHLDPVVMIGGDGLTPAVIKEANAALTAHGLIKIRVLGDDRAARERMYQTLASELNAAPIQHIGKLLVLWRPVPEKEKALDEDRMPGPRDFKVLKYSKRGGQRPEVKTLRVLGNQRLTPGGQVKRAKPKMKSVKKGAKTDRMKHAAALPRNVICMKWGAKYGPEYVNRLYAMVRRHLTGEFRMVCLTDDASRIRPEVECFPIPPLDLPPGIPERGWTKLVTFAADLYGLEGTALFLDVDVVIVGSLDEFFSHPGQFVVIHDYKRPWRITGNSSVYRFELGAHPDVLAYFRTHVEEVRAAFRNEQAYLSDFLHKQGKLTYWPSAWCPSFKYHGIPAWPSNYWKPPFVPPGARIVIFHGECNPPDALAGRRNRRFRFIKPARWVADHWRE